MNIYGIVASIFLWTHAFSVITCSDPGTSVFNIKSTTENNKNLVEVIKQDLKRNNDDYMEVAAAFTTKPAYVAIKQVPVSFQNKRIMIKSNTKMLRRLNDKSYENYDFISNMIKNNKTNNNLIPRANKRVGKLQPGLNFIPIVSNQSIIPNIKNVNDKYSISFLESMRPNLFSTVPHDISKMPVNKLKLFKNNNKGLLQPRLRHNIINMTTRKMDVKFPINNHNLIGRISESANKHTVGYNDGKLPNPKVLDMAPAKGGRIHKQRIKDRLCFRHVLMPEGPKYDSNGRVYLAAHAVAVGTARDFPRTMRPKLLLPRCCNCCKKSVLGCE